jgi:cyclic pyranopterin phosphate synthase
MRLSADGMLYTCLFASQGSPIKTAMRQGASDEQLREVISSIWQKRADQYSEIRARDKNADNRPKVEMYHIGG